MVKSYLSSVVTSDEGTHDHSCSAHSSSISDSARSSARSASSIHSDTLSSISRSSSRAHSTVDRPSINLYLLLPHRLSDDDNRPFLDPHNWSWVHTLALPISTLDALPFAQRPYKWIHYAAGVILGLHEGFSLSFGRDPAEHAPVNYTGPLNIHSRHVYCHCTDAARSAMFPADPHMCEGESDGGYSSDGSASSFMSDFDTGVAERDGGRCVVTGLPPLCCRAVHIVDYRKGDAYLRTLTSRRGRREGDVVSDVDDERNGLFITPQLKRALGATVGLMKTPNFALTTRDVDPSAAHAHEPRVSVHVLALHADARLLNGLPNGAPIRRAFPDSTSVATDASAWWPPDSVLEAAYACALLRQFGTRTARERIKRVWRHAFRPAGKLSMRERRVARVRRRVERNKARARAREGGSVRGENEKTGGRPRCRLRRGGADEDEDSCRDSDLSDAGFRMVIPLKEALPEEMKGALVRRRVLEEKVKAWREGIIRD